MERIGLVIFLMLYNPFTLFMHQEIFSELGFTKSESKIYMTLLDLGTAQLSHIMEKTGMHRRNIYDSLSRLMVKGLVSFVILNNRKIFSPASPKRLVGLVEEKKFNYEIHRIAFISISCLKYYAY